MLCIILAAPTNLFLFIQNELLPHVGFESPNAKTVQLELELTPLHSKPTTAWSHSKWIYILSFIHSQIMGCPKHPYKIRYHLLHECYSIENRLKNKISEEPIG